MPQNYNFQIHQIIASKLSNVTGTPSQNGPFGSKIRLAKFEFEKIIFRGGTRPSKLRGGAGTINVILTLKNRFFQKMLLMKNALECHFTWK